MSGMLLMQMKGFKYFNRSTISSFEHFAHRQFHSPLYCLIQRLWISFCEGRQGVPGRAKFLV